MIRLAAIMVAALTLAGAAAAAESPREIVVQLGKNPVYVSAQAPGTDSDTAGVLAGQLRDGDNIVVAMLPANSETTVQEVASELRATRIVGISSGDDVTAYSTLLPSGVAADLMRRAVTVSTTNVETLGTFIQNVHDWQTQHPKAVASQTSKDSGSNFVIWLLVVIVLIGAAIVVPVIVVVWKGGDTDSVRLKKSPDSVKPPLERLLELRDEVNDPDVCATLTQIGRDTEAFFQRSRASKRDTSGDAIAFTAHLESLVRVMEKYVDIQNHRRYYRDPDADMLSGADAASSVATFVLESIRRGERRGLTDFHVDTNILSAQRLA